MILGSILAKLFRMMTRIVIAGVVLGLFSVNVSQAGVFNLPKYIAPSQFGIGVEPELTLTSGAGIGIQARFQYGVGEITNAHLIVGNGQGPKQFRVGGAMAFDFFPDIEGQPGIGLAVQALYSRVITGGRMDATAIPYIQKTIKGQDSDFTPYAAIPIGLAFLDTGAYATVTQFVFGSRFKLSERFLYMIELGIGITSSDTYMSTGLMIYP